MTIAQKAETVVVHDALWPQRVQMISDKLHCQFPEVLHGRVEAGTAIAQHPKRFRLTDGVWEVADLDAKTWFKVNGSCACGDTEALEGWCKHRLGINIYQRAQEIPDEELVIDPAIYGTSPPATTTPPPVATPLPEPEEVADLERIPRQFIHFMHGKPHVLYKGLLAMAHEQGLVSLEAGLSEVTKDLAVAWARATFPDGRVFVEAGDATPANVGNAKIAPHFPRMALTRAKARALRDALNIGMVAVEELTE